jgi:hypothetical protein
MKTSILLAGAALIAVAVTSASAQDPAAPATPATPDATAAPAATPAPAVGTAPAAPTATGHISAAPSDKAQVVFFRTGAYAGAATWFKIRENEVELGKLSNQSYFVAVLPPGPHTFTSATENKTHLKMELDAGETYYVRGSLQMGLLLYEVNLAPADQDLFEKHYNHMHMVKFQEGDAAK